jgi:GAF domain-containing protein
MSDLQTLVDALAAELDRPTGVDDRHFRSIAYSSHPEGVDSVRIASILQREAPPAVRELLEELGVHEAEDPLRVPANPELGMAARVCVPLHFDDIPLGYLWLIDEPEPLSEEQIEDAQRYGEEFGVALYRARLLERDDRRLERELVSQLIGLRAGDAVQAGEKLLRSGHLVTASAYAVVTLTAIDAARGESSDAAPVRLVDAAEQLRRAVAPHHLVVLFEDGEVIVVLALTGESELARRVDALAAAIRSSEPSGWRPLIGVSEERATIGGVAEAYQHARVAARVSAAIASDEEIAGWEDLGAYRIVAELVDDRDPDRLIPASFARLVASDEAESLIATLERYLDLGGDARAAAEQLFIHRSSLYGRLHRIEEVAGVDLRSGEDRLELHLGLRLWRLAGGRLDP